jgi:serine protease Do
MIRRSLAFILIGAAAGAAVHAQTPAPRTGGESRVFSMFFDGDGGYLGVEATEVTKENFGTFGLRDVRGVAIERVVDGSPAEAAGLRAGDVIVKFNGEDVTSVRKLTRLIADVAPDHQVKLTVFRSGSDRELTATLAKRPVPRFDDGAFSMAIPGQGGRLQVPRGTLIPNPPDSPLAMPPLTGMPRIEGFPPAGAQGDFLTFRSFGGRQIGISITPLTKQLSDHFGVTSGVMINNVRENSPAAKAGLKAGDIIVEVDGKELKGDMDLVRAIAEKRAGDVQLTIVRDRNRQTLNVTPEDVKSGFQSFEFPDDGSVAPGGRILAPPAAPPAPAPLNNLFVPGRVL